ncbi:hypothetical protein [Succinimonas sp.]|uniref:hypothetical protein n=1 Tax=Succinimonas sp. TaxID=1936151 RepID=UPI003870CC08
MPQYKVRIKYKQKTIFFSGASGTQTVRVTAKNSYQAIRKAEQIVAKRVYDARGSECNLEFQCLSVDEEGR